MTILYHPEALDHPAVRQHDETILSSLRLTIAMRSGGALATAASTCQALLRQLRLEYWQKRHSCDLTEILRNPAYASLTVEPSDGQKLQ
jgi:hypothetical protein